MVVSQLLHGGTLQIVPQLQNAFGGLFIRQPTMILHDGHQSIKASCLGIVRHGHALPRCDIKKAKTVQFPQAFMHHCLADLHGISQFPLGGQLVAGAQFTRQDHAFQLLYKQFLNGWCHDLTKAHKYPPLWSDQNHIIW